MACTDSPEQEAWRDFKQWLLVNVKNWIPLGASVSSMMVISSIHLIPSGLNMFSPICKSYREMERHETKGEMTKKGERDGKRERVIQGGRRKKRSQDIGCTGWNETINAFTWAGCEVCNSQYSGLHLLDVDQEFMVSLSDIESSRPTRGYMRVCVEEEKKEWRTKEREGGRNEGKNLV